jgi:hypothetical protein
MFASSRSGVFKEAPTNELATDSIAAEVSYADGATLRALLRQNLSRGGRELRGDRGHQVWQGIGVRPHSERSLSRVVVSVDMSARQRMLCCRRARFIPVVDLQLIVLGYHAQKGKYCMNFLERLSGSAGLINAAS